MVKAADVHATTPCCSRAEIGDVAHESSPNSTQTIGGNLGGAMSNQDHPHLHPTKLALSREEAARTIGVSAITIDRLTKRGLLFPSRATRRPLYPIWEIERFLRETCSNLQSLSNQR